MYFGEILPEPVQFQAAMVAAHSVAGLPARDAHGGVLSVPTDGAIPDGQPSEERAAGAPPVAREAVLAEARALLANGDHVLLVGPPGVGKTVCIRSLESSRLATLDPLVDVSPHAAGDIRRAMDRGIQFLAATRSLDRAYLGAVRRIAWRFSTVRVPPLSARWMRHLVIRACAEVGLLPDLVSPTWMRWVVRLARGCPGVALAIVRAAAHIHASKGEVPSPSAACIEASIERHGIVRAAQVEARARRSHRGHVAHPSPADTLLSSRLLSERPTSDLDAVTHPIPSAPHAHS